MHITDAPSVVSDLQHGLHLNHGFLPSNLTRSWSHQIGEAPHSEVRRIKPTPFWNLYG